MGGALQHMVEQHQVAAEGASWGLPGDALPPPTPGLTTSMSWDGTRLEVDWSSDVASVFGKYRVELDMSHGIDGTFSHEYIVAAMDDRTRYATSAVYDAVTVDGSCVTGGSVTLRYDVVVDTEGAEASGVDQGGTVVVDYGGCNDVSIRGI